MSDLIHLHSRFDDIDAYFANIVENDVAKEYSMLCAYYLASLQVVQDIGYNPFISLSLQPHVYRKYFDFLEKNGVNADAEEYLPTRSWFMQGTVSAPLLLMAALIGRGEYVEARAGNFPEDLYYIIHA